MGIIFNIEVIAFFMLLIKILIKNKYYFEKRGFWFYLFFIVTYIAYLYFDFCTPDEKFFILIKNILCIGAITYLKNYYYRETDNIKLIVNYKNIKKRKMILKSFSISSIGAIIMIAIAICLYPIYDNSYFLTVIILSLLCLNMLVCKTNIPKHKTFYLLFVIIEIFQKIIFLMDDFDIDIILIAKVLQIIIILYNIFLTKEIEYE